MALRITTALPLAFATSLLCGAGLSAAAEREAHAPPLSDVVSSVTLMMGEGSRDRAVLVENDDDSSADLYIYRNLPNPGDNKPPPKPDFVKKGVAFAGILFGQTPSLSTNGKGSLVISSENTGLGRVKWEQTVTVVARDGTYLVAGITYKFADGLDPKAGGSCDLNLLTGKGTQNGKPVTEKLAPIPLADWSDEKLLKVCQN